MRCGFGARSPSRLTYLSVSTAAVNVVVGLLTWVAIGFLAGSAVLVVSARFATPAAAFRRAVLSKLGPAPIAGAWVVAAGATVVSLYYSEFAGFTPCELCWYQRIAMYPLVLVLGLALLRDDRIARWQVAALATVGAGLSLYHYLVQRIPQLGGEGCAVDADCTLIWIEEFGFMTLPFMGLIAFLLILTLVFAWPRSGIERAA